MNLNKLIQNRKSIRRFTNKTPDWRDIIEAIDAARFAPMAGNTYSPRFLVINDEEKIQKISEAAQQPFISQAQYVVIVCSDEKKTKNAFEERGEKYLKQQAGAAIENFLLKLEELGLSTCWVGHFVDKMIKREFKIPNEVDIEAIFPIGYESKIKGEKKKEKTKIEIDRILYFHEYGNKKMKPATIVGA